MKNNGLLVWTICCLVTALFLFACAGQKKNRTLPGDSLPQIGIRQASVSKETPPEILAHLIKKAEQQIGSQEPEAAFITLENALGIDAQDPVLWHLMARVQLMQGNLDQAEQLAKKSNLLAARNPSLEKKNWEIITRSRTLRGKIPGAESVKINGE